MSLPPRYVHKYLDAADRFVRVRVRKPDELGLPREVASGVPLGRVGYRRAVVQACVEELEHDFSAALDALVPGDPEDALELMYQLCVAVNPGLEIHAIGLVEENAPAEAVDAAVEHEHDAMPQTRRSLERRLRRRARGLASVLRERVIGQDEAVGAAVRAVERAAAGLAEEGRPLASFLFVGPTGSGKTELARALAASCFDRPPLAIDCSEYAQSHEIARLVGAPPGYVGHDRGGSLTDELLENPARVVLFDEVEKAHPALHRLLLQILEEGRLTDGRGQLVPFDRALVVLTSNAGADERQAARHRVGFRGAPGSATPAGAPGCAVVDSAEAERDGHGAAVNPAGLAEIGQRAVARTFPPELLGRLDERIDFRELDHGDVRRIAAREIAALALRVRLAGGRVRFTRAIAGWVADQAFDPSYGAREIKRVVRRELEGPLASLLLAQRRGDETWHVASVRRGRLRIELDGR